MSPQIEDNHPLRQYFAGVLEDAFYTQLGICAPDVVVYLTDLLAKFVHIRDIYALKGSGGEVLSTVTDMLNRAYLGPETLHEHRERILHRHVGDFTLYWMGLYPESLRIHRHGGNEDVMKDFTQQGKRSYAIACELTRPDDRPPAAVLQRLSEHFEYCAYGLTLARRNWEAHDGPAEH